VGQDGGVVEVICPTREAKYFFKQDWTGRNSLIPKANFLWPSLLLLRHSGGHPLPSRPRTIQTVIGEERSDEAIQLPSCGAMDCFAEPVIGRAFARPVGSQ
jgi:hypothetical protein